VDANCGRTGDDDDDDDGADDVDDHDPRRPTAGDALQLSCQRREDAYT